LAAQEALAPTPEVETAEDAVIEDSGTDEAGIVVTGSRIKRDGYSAPTPETVIGAEAIANAAPGNIADFVNDLPQLSGSSTPRSQPSNLSGGSSGSNFLNLRGLGANRTLVLLDGRRVVGSSITGRVDVNTLPSALISRIDVVTGGASAAYGSDAVAGVVNFILDTKFEGLKLEAMNGITTYGDDYRYKLEAAGGLSFAGGRGHFIASATHSKNRGVLQAQSRPWFNGAKVISNPARTPTNGLPLLIQPENANTANASLGGLITTGVLAGTQFGSGGAISQRQFGTPAGAMYTLGGELQDQAAFQTLDIPLQQTTAFARLSFDVSDAIELFGEFNYGKAKARNLSVFNWRFGDLTLRSDNAFLPDTLRTQLATAGEASFQFGTFNGDIGQTRVRNDRELLRFVGGANLKFGGGWTGEIYATYGRVDALSAVSHLVNKANYALAVDAVRDPVTNAIVCRSTLTNPGNGCIPFNPFGIGVNDEAALSYATGTSQLETRIEQTVVAGSVQGEPFSTWAGPVSVVVGGEYREEKVKGEADAVSLANGYFAGNYKPTIGAFDVAEAFAETIVPLARDTPFFYSADLNAAVRYTDYSTSGSVTTWKVGGTWNPVADLRLRVTRSRDIRAPNINDLFLGGVVATGGTVIDNGVSVGGIQTTSVGNPDLMPERADTLTAGIVYTPGWLPGFSVSVDFYEVKVRDAIQSIGGQAIVDRCNAGNQLLCALVTRTNGVITAIRSTPTNIARERARGVDIEAGYQTEIGADTRINLRGLATYVDERSLDDGITVNYQQGENSPDTTGGSIPKWRVIASAGVDSSAFKASITGRYVSPGKYDNAYTPLQLADNSIAGAAYFDFAGAVKFAAGSGEGEIFLNIDNIFNKDPVIIPHLSQPFFNAPVNPLLYDTLGREFRVGARVKF
jgi:iron complex outermembrane receptor protein